MDKGSGSESGIFPDPNPDPGDPKRPDPTGSDPQHRLTLLQNGRILGQITQKWPIFKMNE